MRRNDWTHLALLLAVMLWIASAHHVIRIHTDAPALGWMTATRLGVLVAIAPFSSILRWLALLPALIVGTSAPDRHYTRRIVTSLVVTLVLMLAVDTLIGPAAFRAIRREAQASPATLPTYVHDTTFVRRSPIDSLGALRAGYRVLRTSPAALREPLGQSWYADNPRTVATDASFAVATMVLPFTICGIVLGVLAWIRRRTMFRTNADARTARWFVAWTIAVLAWTLSGVFAGSSYEVLRSRDYWAPLRSQWPFVVLAVLGLLALRRERRWDAGESLITEQPGTRAGAHEAASART